MDACEKLARVFFQDCQNKKSREIASFEMLVRILYLNVVSKLIFLTIVLLNNLTKKIKDFEIHYSGFCRIRMIKIDLSIIFQVICGLITVMNNVNVHIFNTFSVLFYSKHAYVNRTKKNPTVSHVHSFMHTMNTFRLGGNI